MSNFRFHSLIYLNLFDEIQVDKFITNSMNNKGTKIECSTSIYLTKSINSKFVEITFDDNYFILMCDEKNVIMFSAYINYFF